MMAMSVDAQLPPRVPLRPVLNWGRHEHSARMSVTPSVLDAGHTAFVTSGRIAIALAAKALRLRPGDEVLIPSFHCSSMVEPLVWAGATPIFFRLMRDGSADMADIATKLTKKTRALLVAHYFGFPQEMPLIREFCDKHGIALIEDCAHAFFGSVAERPLGSFGDYAIASPWKFFPVYDGGCLISSRHDLSTVALRRAGWPYEIKSTLDAFEYAFAYGRMPAFRRIMHWPLQLKRTARSWVTSRDQVAVAIGSSALEGGFGFEPQWLDKRMSFASRLLVASADRPEIVARRRNNFTCLLEGLSDLPGVVPFHESLPGNVVPHVFPLQVTNPTAFCQALKQRRIPFLRFGEVLWDGVDNSVCENSVRFSRTLFQLPCHQGLTREEIAWMVTNLTDILCRTSTRHVTTG